MKATRPMRALLLLLLLTACGGLPQPFAGNPGATAMRLAQPPPSRLAVPAPTTAMLTDSAATAYAAALAKGLDDVDVPAVAGPAHPGDWQLRADAKLTGQAVKPSFTIVDPTGKDQGTITTRELPAADWSASNRQTLTAVAADAVPRISDLLTRLQAIRAQSDPNSLLNRPARIFFAGVFGAPGDGNRALATQFRLALTNGGTLLVDTQEDADIWVRGEVRTAPTTPGSERVEVQWIVAEPRGERGRVVQVNEVPRGSLNGLWADVAQVVASQAATGVKRVIETSSGGGPIPPMPEGGS